MGRARGRSPESACGATEELEETIISLVVDLWLTIGNAIRADEDEVVINSTMDPATLETALRATEASLAFVPYARDAGVQVADDERAITTLRLIIDLAFGQIRSARVEAAAHVNEDENL